MLLLIEYHTKLILTEDVESYRVEHLLDLRGNLTVVPALVLWLHGLYDETPFSGSQAVIQLDTSIRGECEEPYRQRSDFTLFTPRDLKKQTSSSYMI